MLVSTYKVENPTVGLLLRSEIVISSSSKDFAINPKEYLCGSQYPARSPPSRRRDQRLPP